MNRLNEQREYTKTITPPHYTKGDYEPIKVIDAWGLCFYLGNALKYINRAGKKEGQTKKDDLIKAIHYLQMEVDKL